MPILAITPPLLLRGLCASFNFLCCTLTLARPPAHSTGPTRCRRHDRLSIGHHRRDGSRDSAGTADAPGHAGSSPTSALERNQRQRAVDDNCPVRLWDYLTGERPISYRPIVQASLVPSRGPPGFGDLLQSTRPAASSGAFGATERAKHDAMMMGR